MCQNQTFHTSLTVGRLLNDPQMRRFLQRTIGLGQLLQQQPGLLEVKRVETLGKPAIDRRKQFVGLPPSALIKPQTRHARRCAQLQDFAFCSRAMQRARSKCASAFAKSGPGANKVISPAVRCTSASDHLSLVVSTDLIASSMQRQPSSNSPTSAWACAKKVFDRCRRFGHPPPTKSSRGRATSRSSHRSARYGAHGCRSDAVSSL
jgi:hypothetical protein